MLLFFCSFENQLLILTQQTQPLPRRATRTRADAARLFDEVKRARDVLLDVEARAKYDAVLRARAAREERDASKSVKQREMMDKLLAGEEANRKQKEAERHAKQQLDAELERLRSEMRQHELARNERARRRAADATLAASWQKVAAQVKNWFFLLLCS